MSVSHEIQNFLLQNKNEILAFFQSTASHSNESSSEEFLDSSSYSGDRRYKNPIPRLLKRNPNVNLKVGNEENTPQKGKNVSERPYSKVSGKPMQKQHERRRILKVATPPNDLTSSKKPCRCVGIFGMSRFTDERDLLQIFSEFGKIEKIHIIRDRYNQRSRGFGFVYLRTVSEAANAIRKLSNAVIDGHKVRIDYSFSTTSIH